MRATGMIVSSCCPPRRFRKTFRRYFCVEVASGSTKKFLKRGLPPMHPGELLREEILPALDRPKTEIAKLLGVSRQTLV